MSKDYKPIEINYWQVITGSTTIPTAVIGLHIDGKMEMETASGVCPVHAAHTAIDRLIEKRYGIKPKLKNWGIVFEDNGSNAFGKANATIGYEGTEFDGVSSKKNVIEAAILVYLSTINEMLPEYVENQRREKLTLF